MVAPFRRGLEDLADRGLDPLSLGPARSWVGLDPLVVRLLNNRHCPFGPHAKMSLEHP